MKRAVHIPNFLKIASKRGASPGTLIHVGVRKMEKVHMQVFQYNEESYEERSLTSSKEIEPQTAQVLWLNSDGLHNPKHIEEIGRQFNLHPLLLEDILNTGQRPKIEEYDDCMFIVLKMPLVNDQSELVLEQVSIVLKENLVLSFQEQPQDVFDTLRDRIRMSKGRIRTLGADYLMYRLIDSMIDGYFTALETIGDSIEQIEKQLLEKPDDAVIQKIYSLRQQMLFMRKAVHPLRDVTSQLQHGELSFIHEGTILYLRDLYDHTIQVIDAVDTYRDILSNMLDNYLSLMSHRMNSVMKVLTIVGTIFIPLTFIAGVYGMNFRHMPELDWVWGVMFSSAVIMLGVMKWKRWL
jgi:magnesium transporter